MTRDLETEEKNSAFLQPQSRVLAKSQGPGQHLLKSHWLFQAQVILSVLVRSSLATNSTMAFVGQESTEEGVLQERDQSYH